jgi:CubicO group peptidase (beta-lactamase class C family)
VALPARADTIDRLVIAQMRAQHIPGLALAVQRDGHVETRAYGYANLENCAPADTNTIFGIGSVSKPLTAYATLRLVQAGKLALDDPITRYLPEAKPAWDGITVRDLLTHTSGIRDYPGDDANHPRLDVDRKAEFTPDSIVRLFARAPLNFAPGSEYAYSNSGYLVLSLVLERAAGQPFPEVMRTLVYEPLGMYSTQSWDPTIIVPGRATGYAYWSGVLHPGVYVGKTFGRYGDTALLSTAGDLVRFAAELMHPRLLSPALLHAMETRTLLPDGAQTFYGMGIFPGDVRGEPMLVHGGSFIAGYTAYLLALPTRGLAVTVATNAHHGQTEPLAFRIASLVDDSLHWVPSAAAVRDPEPTRTARVVRFFRADSAALPMTSGFHRQYNTTVRALIAAMAPKLQSVTFLACDDLRRGAAHVLPPQAASECYYRLRLGSDDQVFALYFTLDGAVAGVFPKFY